MAPTLQRVEAGAAGVIVATAGNTGRAFADIGADVGFPVVVVTAEAHVDRIWRSGRAMAPTTAVVGIADGDYNDAIEVAAEAAARVGFELEGGMKNVARRDGIGTLLLDAVTTIGRMPDHYVQAVGGGPGPGRRLGRGRAPGRRRSLRRCPAPLPPRPERHPPPRAHRLAGRSPDVGAG